MKELVLHVRHIPDFKNAEVVVRPVAVREYEGERCFVSPFEQGFETKRLPNDFFLREFMALDYKNETSMRDFQEEWGLIFSAMSTDEYDPLAIMNRWFCQNHESIKNEVDPAKLSLAIRSWQALETAEGVITTDPEQATAVCFDEASACVSNMQTCIKTLVEAAENGVICEEGNDHYTFAIFATRYLSEYVDKWFKTISLIQKSDAVFGGNDVPIMAMIAAQCLYGIQTKEHGDYVFKRCLYCGEAFQFGRKSEEGDGLYKPRPAGSAYCSPKCQKYYNKHKNNADGKRRY